MISALFMDGSFNFGLLSMISALFVDGSFNDVYRPMFLTSSSKFSLSVRAAFLICAL